MCKYYFKDSLIHVITQTCAYVFVTVDILLTCSNTLNMVNSHVCILLLLLFMYEADVNMGILSNLTGAQYLSCFFLGKKRS